MGEDFADKIPAKDQPIADSDLPKRLPGRSITSWIPYMRGHQAPGGRPHDTSKRECSVTILSFSRCESILQCSFGFVSEVASTAQANTKIFFKRRPDSVLCGSPYDDYACSGTEAITIAFGPLRPSTRAITGLVDPRMHSGFNERSEAVGATNIDVKSLALGWR